MPAQPTQALLQKERDGTFYEKEVRDAFTILHRKGIMPQISIHGHPIRQLILDSAQKLPGYAEHEVGEGYVSERLLLDHLATLKLGRILSWFCDNISVAGIPSAVWDVNVFDREELTELAKIGNDSRPIWVYDFEEPRFVVNRIIGGKLVEFPTSHGGKVAAAGANLV